jgi:hypothetical protein
VEGKHRKGKISEVRNFVWNNIQLVYCEQRKRESKLSERKGRATNEGVENSTEN